MRHPTDRRNASGFLDDFTVNTFDLAHDILSSFSSLSVARLLAESQRPQLWSVYTAASALTKSVVFFVNVLVSLSPTAKPS